MEQKYEGYFITSCGRVWSYYKKGFLKPRIKKGRNQASIHGKDMLVSRLVAETYLPNPDNLPEINHKDKNRGNNCLNNLEWCDRKYNCNYKRSDKK